MASMSLTRLEDPDASKIREHVAENCATCLREIRAYSEVWYLTGAAISQERRVQFPDGLRRKVLQAAQATPIAIRKRAPIRTWVWVPGIAAAILICAAVWSLGKFGPDASLSKELQTQRANLELAQRSERQWQERAQEAERQLAAVQLPVAVPAGKPLEVAPPASQGKPETSAALAKAQTEIQSLTDALSRERTQGAALVAELNSQKSLLATALQQKDEVERRTQGAADEASKRAELPESRGGRIIGSGAATDPRKLDLS